MNYTEERKSKASLPGDVKSSLLHSGSICRIMQRVYLKGSIKKEKKSRGFPF